VGKEGASSVEFLTPSDKRSGVEGDARKKDSGLRKVPVGGKEEGGQHASVIGGILQLPRKKKRMNGRPRAA